MTDLPDLIVVRGAEAAAWAAGWVGCDPGRRGRVNAADLHRMLYGPHTNLYTARAARLVEVAAVRCQLQRNASVVVDDPDLDDATVAAWDTVAWACAARLHVVAVAAGELRYQPPP